MPNRPHPAPSVVGEPSTGSQAWGFEALALDETALAQGRLVVGGAHGTWPDGSTFCIEPDTVTSNAIALPIDASEATVFVVASAGEPAVLMLAPPVGARAVPVVRLLRSGSAWTPDCTFVPPTRCVRASKQLMVLHRTVMALVEARAFALAERLGSNSRGVAEIAEFLFLMALNPALAELRHLDSLPDLHPERLFESLLRLHAVLSTLQDDERLPVHLAPYSHDDCGPPFEALGAALRKLLSVTLAPTGARLIELTQRKYGIYTALLDPGLGPDTRLVLEVRAALPSEVMRTRFPTMVKIGSAESIREMVNSQLPGLALRALSAVPRQLPYVAGATYFELEFAQSTVWPHVLKSGNLALHVAGEFPDLTLALWHIA